MNNDSKVTNKIHILLVDDAKTNRLLGKKMLENLSCEVTLAEDGLHALDILRTSDIQFNFILMDLEMPRLGGLQAATEIREQKLSYAPIYAVTGHDTEESRFLCRAAKMNGFITKPLQIDKLEKLVAKYY